MDLYRHSIIVHLEKEPEVRAERNNYSATLIHLSLGDIHIALSGESPVLAGTLHKLAEAVEALAIDLEPRLCDRCQEPVEDPSAPVGTEQGDSCPDHIAQDHESEAGDRQYDEDAIANHEALAEARL